MAQKVKAEAAPIRIAFINVMEGYSGGEIALERLIRGLDKKAFSSLLYSRPGKLADRLSAIGCPVHIIQEPFQMKTRRGAWAAYRAIKNFLIAGRYVFEMKRKEKIDIIHSNSLTSSIYFAFWAKLFGLRFVAHNHLIRRGAVYRILYRYINLCSDRVVCVSEAVKKCWLDEEVPEEKLVVIYNGLPDDFF